MRPSSPCTSCHEYSLGISNFVDDLDWLIVHLRAAVARIEDNPANVALLIKERQASSSLADVLIPFERLR